MVTEPIEKLTKDEIREEIDLYVKAEVITADSVPAPEALKPELVEFLENLRESIKQMPHVVTDEDIAANADLTEQGIKVGDVILLPIPTGSEEEEKAKKQYEAEEEAKRLEEEKATAELQKIGDENEANGLNRDGSPRNQVQSQPPIQSAPTGTLYFRKQIVTNVDTRILNGKFYKDIRIVDGSTYLLSEEEYAREVSSTYNHVAQA